MNNLLFESIESDFYTRKYTLSGKKFGKSKVIVYAECSKNKEKINGHTYYLEVLFSVDLYGDREFLIGVTFGDKLLDQKTLDREIDEWVEQFVSDETFLVNIADYLEKEEPDE